MKSLSLISLLFLITASFAIGAEDKVVVCYYGPWAAYRQGLGKFEVTDIPTNLCTHLIYTFAGLDYSGNVVSLDPYLDYAENWGKVRMTLRYPTQCLDSPSEERLCNVLYVQGHTSTLTYTDTRICLCEAGNRDYLRKLNALKIKNPELRTILAVGGHNEGSQKYSLMASNPQLRRNFITTSINMLTKYGFNGLAVDWEFPNRKDTIYGQEDVNNFSQLLKELREEFDKRGLLLTAAVTAPEVYANLSYNVSAISSYLDLVSIMTYDMYGAWDPVTGHNAPLHEGEGNEAFTVDVALQYWLKQGCPPEKLVLGMAFYGRTFLLSSENSSVRAPSSGTGLAGPYTQTRGLIGYNELCHKFITEVWDLRQDTLAKVPYAVQQRNWVSYDDPKSLVAKVAYGLQYGIAGVMVWSIETDDFHGICHDGAFPLLRHLNAALGRRP